MIPFFFEDFHFCRSRVIGLDMTENRVFTLCRMITWVVFLRMFWNFISSLPVNIGGSLSFLTIFTFCRSRVIGLDMTENRIFICPSRDGPYYVIGYGGRAGIHTDFRTITLVLYIKSLPILATWLPCWRGRILFILGSLGQRSRSLTINIIFDNRIVSHDNFSSVYIGSLPSLATWFPCWQGRTLFILGSLPLYCLIIYIDGHILWCTHFLFCDAIILIFLLIM